jgi:hypothetical protein
VSPSAARSLRRALAAAVADARVAAPVVDRHLTERGWAGLVEAAAGHGVAPRVWQAVAAAGRSSVPEAEGLFGEAQRSALRRARALADLRAVGEALAREGVVPTVVKGPALAELGYRQPGDRSYDDLDVLVEPAELGAALSALEQAGFVSLDRNWPAMHRLQVGQVRLRAPSGGVLDLHWHLLNEVRLRSSFRLDRPFWEAGLTPAHIAGVPVTVLDRAATIVHVAVHAALSGGHRMVWLQDLNELTHDEYLDWTAVTDLAAATGTGVPVAVMLARAQRMLGACMPSQVLGRLVPAAGWRALAAATDRISPPPLRPGAGSFGQMVARSSRADARSSARELAHRARAWSAQGSRAEARTAAHLFDDADPASMSHPAGDATDRRVFLAAVAGQDRA